MQISEIIKHYKETNDNDYFNRIVHYFDKELNKISWKVLGRIDEDIKQEFYLELYTKILPKNDILDFKNYILKSANLFFKRKKVLNNQILCGLTKAERYKALKLFHNPNKTAQEIKELEDLHSKIVIHTPLQENIEFKYTIFDDIKDILSEEEYDLVVKIYKENKSYREVGDELGISYVSVFKKLKFILKKIKKYLID